MKLIRKLRSILHDKSLDKELDFLCEQQAELLAFDKKLRHYVTICISLALVNKAQVNLAELVSNLAPGEEVVITDNQQPVARLVSVKRKAQRKLGTMRGSITYIAPDSDAPLDDFQEYTQ